MLDWLIVGGGIHGTYLSQVLIRKAGIRPDRLRVIDPEPQPLAAWRRTTNACGMRHLRSPAAHNLDLSARALIHQAQPDELAGPYRRPSLALFNRHCDALVERHRLHQPRVPGWAERIQSIPGGYQVQGPGIDLTSKRVLLAPGPPPRRVPAWAAAKSGVMHLFDPAFLLASYRPRTRVCVVGGGLSAAQCALTLAARGCQVSLLGRGPLKVADFDAAPCYLGPKCLTHFTAVTDPAKRRRLIDQARHPGSITPSVHARLLNSPVHLLEAEVAGYADGYLHLHDGRHIPADRVVLATGFLPQPPGGALYEYWAGRLPIAADGFPITDTFLQWRTGLFVSGRLAELTLGPAAANIAGARLAGRRLLAYCKHAS